MKTKFSIAACTVLLCISASAQDVITLKNGNELLVKVLEVAPTEVKYKKFDNPEGPTYSDLKSNIFMIKYENGMKDVFTNKQKETTPPQALKTVSKEIMNYDSPPADIHGNNDFIVTVKGDTIRCIIDLVTNTNISYHILRQGPDTRACMPMTHVARFFNNYKTQKEIVLINSAPQHSAAAEVPTPSGNADEDEFLPEVRRYGGPRMGATFVGNGAYKNVLLAEGKRNVYSQFGWQFEKRLFTTKTGISAMVEFVPMIGGIDMGKFIPSVSGLIGIRIKNGFELGAGPNLAIYGGKDIRGDYQTSTNVGIVIAAGMSLKSDKVYFPINIVFVPSVGKKATYVDSSTGETISKKYETGAKISLLVGFNYRKR